MLQNLQLTLDNAKAKFKLTLMTIKDKSIIKWNFLRFFLKLQKKKKHVNDTFM